MKEPCKSCPFRMENGISLAQKRIREIVAAITHDGSFNCHNTIDYSTGKPKYTEDTKLCFGSTLFLENVAPGGCRSNVMYRLGLRVKQFSLDDLRRSTDVFASLQDMLDAAID